MNTRIERCLSALSGLLLGAGLGCFVLLIPLPWFVSLVRSPGATTLALTIGSACLIASSCCLLLRRLYGRRDAHRFACARLVHAEEQGALQDALSADDVQSVPGLSSEEEREQLPSWLRSQVYTHYFAGREAIAARILNEWRPWQQLSHKTVEANDMRLVPCGICGLPDPAALLYPCARCQALAHAHCSTFVRRAHESGATLSIDPDVRSLCQTCLAALQAQGFKLVSDGLGLLLLRPADATDDF